MWSRAVLHCLKRYGTIIWHIFKELGPLENWLGHGRLRHVDVRETNGGMIRNA